MLLHPCRVRSAFVGGAFALRIRGGSGAWFREGSRRDHAAGIEGQARRGSAAKKAGEGAIIADLARVMVAAARRKGVKLGDPAEIHKRLRDPRTGRIDPRNLQQPYSVDAGALRTLKRDLLNRVGELAAGWNAGAQKLGVKLPAWVARHGSK